MKNPIEQIIINLQIAITGLEKLTLKTPGITIPILMALQESEIVNNLKKNLPILERAQAEIEERDKTLVHPALNRSLSGLEEEIC